MDELEFLLSGMKWSFSRLNSYYTCPWEWHENYIMCQEKTDSSFAQFGSFVHSILEKYAKGELSIFEISQYYEDHFNEVVTLDFPPNKYTDLRQSYYDAGLEYLNNIDLDLEKYEVIGVEKQIDFIIDDKEFVGFIDLLLKDKETGDITILDHKSSKLRFKKDNSISKSDEDHFLEFKRQLYLYSKAVIEEYGSVKWLEWNMFRNQKHVKIPWIKEEYDEAIKWASDTIKLIEAETEWKPGCDFFYGHWLCSQRNSCPYKIG